MVPAASSQRRHRATLSPTSPTIRVLIADEQRLVPAPFSLRGGLRQLGIR
ncbi:hypothetical protein ACGF4C_13765 [Streptomyces sp. NPDC048197]